MTKVVLLFTNIFSQIPGYQSILIQLCIRRTVINGVHILIVVYVHG